MPTNPYKQMVFTKALYRFEAKYFTKAWPKTVKQRSLKILQRHLENAWTARDGCRPTLRFGKGVDGYSWYREGIIELCPGQRDILTLLHEITHARGYDYHNHRFVRAYFRLLSQVCHIPVITLKIAAEQYNVDV